MQIEQAEQILRGRLPLYDVRLCHSECSNGDPFYRVHVQGRDTRAAFSPCFFNQDIGPDVIVDRIIERCPAPVLLWLRTPK